MGKAIVIQQDPPFCKKTGVLFMYPPPPTLGEGDTCLICIVPALSGVET